MGKSTPPWIAGQLRAFALAARHPKLKAAIEAYDRFRSHGIEHQEAVILAAEEAGLDVSRLHDLSWWKSNQRGGQSAPSLLRRLCSGRGSLELSTAQTNPTIHQTSKRIPE